MGSGHEKTSRYFRIKGNKGNCAVVDDITWNDLDMDIFFEKINNTCSQNGGEYLYDMLRRPLIDREDEGKLKERGRVAGLFQDDKGLRDKYIKALGDMEPSDKCFHEELNKLYEAECDSNILHLFSLIFGVIAISFIFIYPPAGFVLFIAAALFNVITYFRRKAEIDSFLPVFRYLIKEMRESRHLTALNPVGLEAYTERLKKAAKSLKRLERNSWLVFSGKKLTGSLTELPLDFIRIFFHIDLIKYNQMLSHMKREREASEELFNVTGFLDAMISVSLFRESLEYMTEPVFKEDGGIEVRRGFHPLIKDAVPYDIDKVSLMLLTGSNASGKSTFLKSAALSIILAETVYTVPAEYCCIQGMEVLSSMSLRDNIMEGDSLYVTEIKSVKRIAEKQGTDRKIAVFLDEVLKGTNTVERIASLSVLLKKLSGCAAVFAATHDTPLTFILEDIYDNYHFDAIVTEDGIHFPYELKEGRTESRDAIRLLTLMGFDKAISDEAFDLSESFMKEGVWKKI